MSYWLNQKCDTCTKRKECTDRHLIQTAINCIHSMPYNQNAGHLGSGEVELKCSQRQPEPVPA
jgi:hypothetical protein